MTTKPTTTQLEAAFHEIIIKLPRAKRQELSPQIEVFKSFFGLTKDLVNLDRRSLTWAPGSAARKAVEENRNLELIFRGVDPIKCNIYEASQLLGKPVHSIRVILGRGQGRWSGQVRTEAGEVELAQLYKLGDDGQRLYKAPQKSDKLLARHLSAPGKY